MLRVSSTFLTRLREPLDWSELQYAYENQLVDGQALIDHACQILSETECADDGILAIASARETDELRPLIERVAGSSEQTAEHARKWALILAAFVSESDVDDKLGAIDEIYSSFDYPEELAPFVRYMPMNGPDLGCTEANEKRMLESLKELSTQVVAST
ncbi:MAG: DUF2247 family protein [Pirellulaceae bacterium]